MDTEVDLTTVDRDVLIANIAELRAVIERLERRIAELEGQAKPGDPLRMPGLEAKSARKPPAQQGPRKQRRHGFARPRLTPTHRVEHVMENCPDCGTHLTGGWTQRTREVIELPVVPVQVAEHVYIAKNCPACRRRCLPPTQLDGVVLGQQRLGVNLLSLIATLREEGRRPIRSVQWYLDTVHQLRRSVGAIVSAIHQAAQRAQPAVAAILDRIRASPVVHADETGRRQDGNNGYVWTFSTPTERYFPCSGQGQALRRGRGKTVVDQALSDAFSGVLVSDCYAAYHHYDGPKQRCWAHLLRDIHDQRTLYPDDTPLAKWADRRPRDLRPGPSLHPSPGQAAAHRATGPGTTTAGPLPTLPGRPVGHTLPTVPSHRAPHQGTFRLRGGTGSAFRQQRRRTPPASSGRQPQGQRRHPVGTGHQQQSDPSSLSEKQCSKRISSVKQTTRCIMTIMVDILVRD